MVRATEAVPDQDLHERVSLALASNMPGLRRLDVLVNAGTVTLRGQVRSFYEKQLGFEITRHVIGVSRFVDEIEVLPN